MKPHFTYLSSVLLSYTLRVLSFSSWEHDGNLLNPVEDEEIEWTYTIPEHGNIVVYEKIMCREHESQNLAWLRYNNFHQCVNLVTDTAIPSCLYQQLERNNLTVINRNKSFLLENFKLRQYDGPKCDTFMILTQDFTFLESIFGNRMKHYFRPFTNIFLFIPKMMIIPQQHIFRAIKNGYNLFTLRNSFFNRSMPYFNLNYWYLKNLATNRTIYTRIRNPKKLANFFGTIENHPLFDNSIYKETTFRIGLFDCPPYVIIRDEKKKKFDGLEYWFVDDVTRGWNINYTVYNKSWNHVLSSIHRHENDMVLCSIWMTESHHNSYALSSYFDQQCLTIMVPRQKPTNVAAVIYLSLQSNIWLYFGIAFVSIVFVLTGITKLGIKLKMYDTKNLPFLTLSNACIEAINTATSHGMKHFPSQTPIKFAIFSWIVFTLLFGVFYSSGFMSLLTTPPLTEPIDNVDDFIKHQMHLGEINDITPLQRELMHYNYSTYTTLANRITFEPSTQIRARNIKSGQFGYIVTTLSNQYITNLPLRNSTKIIPMRLMKSCLMKYFSTLAFTPESPYCSYFSYKLARYQEAGFMWLWFGNIYSNKTNIMDYYLKSPAKNGLLEYEALDLNDLSGAFYLLALGLFISFIVLLFEILIFEIKCRKWLRKFHNRAPSPTLREPILIFRTLLNELPQSRDLSTPDTIL